MIRRRVTVQLSIAADEPTSPSRHQFDITHFVMQCDRNNRTWFFIAATGMERYVTLIRKPKYADLLSNRLEDGIKLRRIDGMEHMRR